MKKSGLLFLGDCLFSIFSLISSIALIQTTGATFFDIQTLVAFFAGWLFMYQFFECLVFIERIYTKPTTLTRFKSFIYLLWADKQEKRRGHSFFANSLNLINEPVKHSIEKGSITSCKFSCCNTTPYIGHLACIKKTGCMEVVLGLCTNATPTKKIGKQFNNTSQSIATVEGLNGHQYQNYFKGFRGRVPLIFQQISVIPARV